MDKPEYPLVGTWDVIDRHGEPRYVVEHDGKGGWWGVCQPDRPEDCYVLAASKDLLAALLAAQEELRLIRMKDTNAVYNPVVRIQMELAIAKAEGR